jgi:hypothetical protein
MRQSSGSVAIWRCVVVILAAIAAVEFALDLFHAPRVLTTGVAGAPLFQGRFLRERGPTQFVVESMPADSPLKDLGVVPGDRLQWDEPIGRWHNLAAGDRVSLTVVHGTDRRRLDVTVPAMSDLPRYQLPNYVMSSVLKLGALVIGVLIGWRRPDLIAYRGLAASALLLANEFPYSAPAAAHFEWLDFAASVSQELALPALVFFAINYPDDNPVGLRARVKRYYPWLFALLAVMASFYYARLYGGFHEPAYAWITRASSIALPALFLWMIVLAWRQARGESRVRLQWLLATLGTIIGAALIGNLNAVVGSPVPDPAMGVVLNAVMLAGMAGFVYAILRRRIFDFGLAVNRTLVFTIVGAILLGVFQLVHGIASEFLRFDDKNKTLVLSAVLAIAVYLSFNHLKKIVEKVVDRVFFNSWAAGEEDLKRFVKEAGHASNAEALGGLLVAALDRFTQGAGCAVYRIRSGDAYLRSEGTLAGMPEQLDANHEAVLAMRAHGKALRIRDGSSSLPATLGLPMAHRGELLGFALLGAKRGGDAYRPDQIAALESAVHQVGLDFYALRIEQLEQRLASEQRNSEALRAQLQTAIEIARSPPAEPAR